MSLYNLRDTNNNNTIANYAGYFTTAMNDNDELPHHIQDSDFFMTAQQNGGVIVFDFNELYSMITGVNNVQTKIGYEVRGAYTSNPFLPDYFEMGLKMKTINPNTAVVQDVTFDADCNVIMDNPWIQIIDALPTEIVILNTDDNTQVLAGETVTIFIKGEITIQVLSSVAGTNVHYQFQSQAFSTDATFQSQLIKEYGYGLDITNPTEYPYQLELRWNIGQDGGEIHTKWWVM